MAPLFECVGVELREAGGDTFSTITKSGRLVIDTGLFGGTSIKVDGNTVDFVASAGNTFKRVDQRTFMLATNDLMTFNYITLPSGLNEEEYDRLDEVLTCMKAGKPVPARKPSAPAAAAAAQVAAPAAPAAPAKVAVPAAVAAPAVEVAAPAAAVAATDAAAATAPAGEAKAGGNELFDLLKAVGAKAAHDTQMLASAIQKKAAHDIQMMQEQQNPKPATS